MEMRRGTASLLIGLTLALAALAAAGAAAAAGTASKLVFCRDITYPPEEFYQGSKPVGSDIEIGTAIAKQLGRTAQFDNTGFDGIIAALQAKKCDLVISGMNDTPARRKEKETVLLTPVCAL